MKRILFSLILALFLALPAAAQVVEDPSTGASISSGSTISGCNAITAILNVVTGALTCNPASVVNGTVSTAGRSILTIRDTISGSSATSNFLNITGTVPASLSAETSGVLISMAGVVQSQPQNTLRVFATGSGPNGGFPSYAVYADNQQTGAFTVGVKGLASGAAVLNNAGVVGIATAGGTGRIGGYFSLVAEDPPATTAALAINNGSVAANIFEARDNGTPVFTIADGGAATFTNTLQTNNTLILSGNGASLQWPAAVGTNQWYGNTNQTPDNLFLSTGSTSNAMFMAEYADFTFDFQNPCTSGLGTSACTDPTLQIHSHNQDTGEFLSMAHDGKAGVIVGGNSTVLDGTIRLGGTVTLTESSATNVLTVPVAVSTATGGEIMYTVEAKDATNTQARRGTVRYAVANNSSGTETCGVYGVDNAVTVNPAETNDGSGAGAITSGTLTYAWSSDTTGTNSCVLKLNAVSSLTQTTFQIHYTVIQSGPGVPTGGD